MSVWIPGWDGGAVTSMQTNAGRLDETNPVWYTLTPEGAIIKTYSVNAAGLRAALTGTTLVPTITNFVNNRWDGDLIARLVSTDVAREQHAEALAQLVVQNVFDGIDLDYESIPGTARANYSAFVALLAQKLHSARKVLSVTVHAKTSDSSTRNGPAGQDWRAIGAAADSVKLMVYSYHWATSDAGPITPIDWLENVVKFAASTIPAQKIIVGLPWYGYDWVGKQGTSVVYEEAMATARRNGVAIARDVNGEATYSYSGRTVFFQDAESFSRKVDAVIRKVPNIGGFAAWRAGAEDPAVWTRVGSLRGSSTTSPSLPAPPPPSTTGAPANGKRRGVRG